MRIKALLATSKHLKVAPATLPSNLPDRKTSKNPWINGSRAFDYKTGRLCVRCGHQNHIAKDCVDEPLPAWEQAYLKEIVFDNPPQVSFAAAGFGDYDGNLIPYGSSFSSSTTSPKPSAAFTPSSSSPAMSTASSANAILFGTAGLAASLPRAPIAADVVEAKRTDAMLGEGSGPNKRAHAEDADEEPDPSIRKQGKQPESRTQPVPVPALPQQPLFPPVQALPQQPTDQGMGQPYQFQAPPQQPSATPQQGEEVRTSQTKRKEACRQEG